jgi:transcriptional regulator with XRE-family HTH domain
MHQKLIGYIREWMDERNLSRNEMALRMKIAPATLGNVLNGKTDSPDKKFFVGLSILTGKSEAELRMMADPSMSYEIKSIPDDLRRAFLAYMSLPEEVRNTIAAITLSKQG